MCGNCKWLASHRQGPREIDLFSKSPSFPIWNRPRCRAESAFERLEVAPSSDKAISAAPPCCGHRRILQVHLYSQHSVGIAWQGSRESEHEELFAAWKPNRPSDAKLSGQTNQRRTCWA